MRNWIILMLPVALAGQLAACGTSSSSDDSGGASAGANTGTNGSSTGTTGRGSTGAGTGMATTTTGAMADSTGSTGVTTTSGAMTTGGGASSSDGGTGATSTSSSGVSSSTGGVGDAGTGATSAGSTGSRDAGTTSTGGGKDGGTGTTTGGTTGNTTGGTTGGTTGTRVSVLQHHNDAARDGVYVDARLTRAAAATTHLDATFAGATIMGPTYAQPLYLAGTGSNPDIVIVATEQNHVYGFDATSGAKVWDRPLGTPLPRSQLASLKSGCGNIDPLGVTGTPVIDAATRTVYLDAMITPNGGGAQHQVFALDADTGAIRSGWPVDLSSTVQVDGHTFESLVQNQRGALALLGGKVFVPFGGHIGDCADYRGWVVGISTTDPTQVSAWTTQALAGGIWGPAGIASDGTSLFFATGNTEDMVNQFAAPANGWGYGEAIFRMPPSLMFSDQTTDYFLPTNWMNLDATDRDIGGTAPVLVNVPGATPSSLVVGLGKDGRAYVLDRANLGGMVNPLAGAAVSTGAIINSTAAYTTNTGTYVVFKGAGQGCPNGQSGGLTAIRIRAAQPPTLSVAWCGGPATNDSPIVSMTDAQGTDAIVWIVGTDNKLHGLNADTGQSVFNGGAGTDTMSAVQKFETPIVANGRVFVAANNQVYAFTTN